MIIRRIAALLAGVLVFLSLPTAPADAALGSFVPRAQTIFNTPQAAGGSRAEQYRLSTFVEKTLAAMSPGSVARIATYSLTVPSTTDAMIAAARRGVNVRVIVDQAQSIQGTRIIKALGSDVKANKSYAIACRYSCNSGDISAMHSKAFTFSSTGPAGHHTAEHISVVGSANLTDTNQYLNWNESRVMTDARIYAGLVKFFDQMRFDRDNEKVFSTFTSANGKDRVYMWPSGSTASDVFLAGLNATHCGPKSNRTVVRVSMFYWVASRYKVADRLVALHKAGCNVAVLYSNDPLHPGFAQTLADRLYRAGIPMWNTRSGHGTKLLYSHSKMLLIKGDVYGSQRALTYNGSANWTNNALINGNEVNTRTESQAVYDQFAARWSKVRAHSVRDTKRPITEPPLTARQRAQANDPDADPDEFEDLDRI